MKRRHFFSFVLLTLLLSMAAAVTPAQSGDEGEVFALVNRERAKARLGTLSWDDRLAKVARDYSRQMAREGFFAHYDQDGRTVIDRAEAARIRNWTTIGENLFVCEDHPYFVRTAIHGWLNSRTHRANMLNRSWSSTGIGIATARDGSIFITQVFTR